MWWCYWSQPSRHRTGTRNKLMTANDLTKMIQITNDVRYVSYSTCSECNSVPTKRYHHIQIWPILAWIQFSGVSHLIPLVSLFYRLFPFWMEVWSLDWFSTNGWWKKNSLNNLLIVLEWNQVATTFPWSRNDITSRPLI